MLLFGVNITAYRFQEEVLDVVNAVDEVSRKKDGRDDCIRHEGSVAQIFHVQTVIALKQRDCFCFDGGRAE